MALGRAVAFNSLVRLFAFCRALLCSKQLCKLLTMASLRLRREGFAWSEVGGEAVLLDLGSSTYFVAKGAGAFIISCLAEPVTEESLVEQVLERYEVDPVTAKADVSGFLKQLDDRNMLERVE